MSLVKLLCKLQYWSKYELEYGFYVRSSSCAVGGGVGRTWFPKSQLILAWGAKDYHIKYLHA